MDIKTRYTEEDGYFHGELLRGYKDKSGQMHKFFVYRDMDGNDEEAMGKENVRNSAYKLVETMLSRCIMQIGTIDKKDVSELEWREIIHDLSIGDQDYAVLKIREEAVGTEIKIKHTCPSCGRSLESIIDTTELEIIPYGGKDEIAFELPKGIRGKDGSVHKTGTIRLPDGSDRQMLSELANKDLSKANTLLLVRTIVKVDGIDIITDETVRKMFMKDRKYLLDLLKDNTFGVDTTVNIDCPCGASHKTSLQVLNFM